MQNIRVWQRLETVVWVGCGYERVTQESLWWCTVLILTFSMSISWLWYHTIALQNVLIGDKWRLRGVFVLFQTTAGELIIISPSSYHLLLIKRIILGASLVAQWLGVCLPMQGRRVRALVWEDPTCPGATRPVSHNYWVCASGAWAPQQERPRWWEARAPRWGVAPACHNWRKPSHRNEDPTQPKINK